MYRYMYTPINNKRETDGNVEHSYQSQPSQFINYDITIVNISRECFTEYQPGLD